MKPVKQSQVNKTKSTLFHIKQAIEQGRLDSIISLAKYTDGYGSPKIQMTMADIDKQIADNRRQEIDNINFARDVVGMFGKYLNSNFRYSSKENGYTPTMIFSEISESDFSSLVDAILGALDEAKNNPSITDFVYGQYVQPDGTPETKEHLVKLIAYQKLQKDAERLKELA